MKNRLKIIGSFILAAVLLFCVCAFAGCNRGDVLPGGASDAEIRAIYDLYVENCAADGETPLTYDAWLASIKGVKGDKGNKGDAGPQGANGKDGNGWLFGTSKPDASLGAVGDLYLNTATWDVYTKETDGWTLRGNIKSDNGGSGGSTKPTLPAGTETYYAPITATSGTALLGQLHDLITTTHTHYSTYADCRDYGHTTDYAEGGEMSIIEFYTHETIVDYIGSTNSPGTWNREHVWPQSLSQGLWPDVSNRDIGGGGDLHHIRPSEKEMNGTRGNDKYGEVTNGSAVWSKTKSGANSQIGGYKAGGAFEPLDEVKGDVARILFYVYTHYNTYANVYGKTNGTVGDNYFGTLHFTDVVSVSSEAEAIALLLEWNELDPVDEIETKRNEEVYKIQGNRNPFIDYAGWADAIWG